MAMDGMRNGRNPFHVFNIRQIEDYPTREKKMSIKVLELHFTSNGQTMFRETLF